MIVVDMEMPRGCGECPLMSVDNIGYKCDAARRYIDELDIREEWCPIVGEVEPQESEDKE